MKKQNDPEVSVVIVCDHKSGDKAGWDDLRAALKGLAAQDFDGNFECLFVEQKTLVGKIPGDLPTLLPNLRIVSSAGIASFDLQNAGVEAARAKNVALLDGDCVPDPDWLRILVTTMRENPDIAVVSGRTTYPNRSRSERILGLLNRAYDDGGRLAETHIISNNNCAYRRDQFLKHPLRNDAGLFGSRVQTEAIRRDGGRLLFEPRMHVVHAFEGWDMERDIRRNFGYAAVATRLVDPEIRYARAVRLGPAVIPFMIIYRILHSWFRSLRSARFYDVAWHEIPIAMATAVLVHFYEVPGMLMAYKGEKIKQTHFR